MKIEIYCGECWEPFTPATINGPGVGGSETAVVHMARELQVLDNEVTVWGTEGGDFDGVQYKDFRGYNPQAPADVLVSWRNVAPFNSQTRPNTKRTVLWLHDLGLPALPNGLVANIDSVFVLSRFHGKAILANNPGLKDKLWYARNGIDAGRYLVEAPKAPLNFFYSSSPRRGLGKLLVDWPGVRKSYPGATLHVAYGFELSIKMSETAGNHHDAKVYKHLLEKVENTEGVVHHGRLGQQSLADVQNACIAWLYPPSDFEETFCITALEAQAAGCIPISRTNGALPEVLRNFRAWPTGVSTVRVLDTLADPNWGLLLEENREHALQYTWANEAKRWMGFFNGK